VTTKHNLLFGVPALLLSVFAVAWAVTPAGVSEGGSASRIIVDASPATGHQTGDIRILAVVDAKSVHAAALLGPKPTSVAETTETDDGRATGALETERAKATAWAVAWVIAHPLEPAPDPAQIPTPDLQGPSLGLAATLGYLDALTDGDLTGGKVVAATGVVASDGSVSAVGKPEVKARTARDVGVQILFVPDDDYAAAYGAVTGDSEGMRIVPVASGNEAIRFLCRRGGVAVGVCRV
jgi:PDZ domain-containing protein